MPHINWMNEWRSLGLLPVGSRQELIQGVPLKTVSEGTAYKGGGGRSGEAPQDSQQ